MGIAVVVAFVVGVLAGVLLFYCISKAQSQSSKPETSFHTQQQVGPENDEVPAASGEERIELRENKAYEPAMTIELRENVAYEPIQH